MPTFGELLRLDREKLKLSQEQLAKMLDVSQQAVANWEAGTAHPRRERRARLLQILGINSELAKNPPRTEFIPAQDQPVSQSTATLRGRRLEQIEMTTNPEFRKQSEEAAKRFEDARQRIEATLARVKMQQEEFAAHLPEELHSYIDGRITVGAQTRQLDYLSPRWGVEIKRASSNKFLSWNHAAPALVMLAVVRGVADQHLRPPREYALILVNEGAPLRADGTMQKLMFDAGVLGISVYQVESFAQAGDLVRQLELEGEDVADETGEAMPDQDDDPQ